MPWGAIAGGIASALLSRSGASSAQALTGRRLQEQMDFQERMSNTAYQRGMADMRLAGLNPILAYKQGGASTLQGAFSPAIDPDTIGLQTGRETAGAIASARQLTAQTKVTREQARLAKLQADRFRDFGDSVSGRNLHTAYAMTKAGIKAGSNVTVEKVKDLTQPFKPPTKAEQKRYRERNTPPSGYRKIRPGEKAGEYFSSPRMKERRRSP